MKQVKKPYIKSYPVLRLYKDDLEEIVDIFKKHFTEIDIVADIFQLADIADVNNIKKSKITNFSVKHLHHYPQETPFRGELLSLELTHNSAQLYLSNDADTYLLGVASQIDALLSRKKSVLGFMASHRLYKLCLIIYVPVLLVLLSALFNSPLVPRILWKDILPIFTTILGAWVFWMTFTLSKRYCVIYLINSQSKSNFFSRYKDQLIYGFISIFFTILGGLLYYFLISAFFHK